MSRHLIILNPVAGAGHAAKMLPTIHTAFDRLGLDHEIVQTTRPMHASELARQAASDGYDYVISAGGDGTTNEIINGLMQVRETGLPVPVLGILPIGRGNDFAFSAGIPLEFEAACEWVAAHPQTGIDIGLIRVDDETGGMYFCNGVGIGFDAVVGHRASTMKLKGMLPYLVAAVQTVFIYYKAPTAKIQLENATLTQPTLMISVMNGRRLGGTFMMSPAARMNDGQFNLCIAPTVSRMDIFRLMVKFIRATHLSDPILRFTHSNHIEVTALAGSLPVHADGNLVCTAGQKITIELLPSALQVITRLPN